MPLAEIPRKLNPQRAIPNRRPPIPVPHPTRQPIRRSPLQRHLHPPRAVKREHSRRIEDRAIRQQARLLQRPKNLVPIPPRLRLHPQPRPVVQHLLHRDRQMSSPLRQQPDPL